ncbi:MAG: M56 family metallopeptidase [Bacteroidota bacterium]
MITYILEVVAIQMVFLLVYDLLLKRETFFQWNRAYLLITFTLSLVLSQVKIEMFNTGIPEDLITYQAFFVQLDEIVLRSNHSGDSFWETFNSNYLGLVMGMMIMSLWLVFKLARLYRLKKNGIVTIEKSFVKVIVPRTEHAFSFFKNVFLGDSIPESKRDDIISHEMVHVDQWHSLDLMFFELMRIVFWFNPLVYCYQNRIAELHEFIADAQVSKTDKKRQYELLLSEVFQSQNFSLVNQFFKKSLIKKRIVMLTKQKSRSVYQLKYVLLLPLLVLMLCYTSCEEENKNQLVTDEGGTLAGITAVGYSYDEELNILLAEIKDLNQISEEEEKIQEELLAKISESKVSGKVKMVDKMDNSLEIVMKEGKISRVNVNKPPGSHLSLQENDQVPFGKIDEAPIFPGCESVEDKKACFMENIRDHISTNFIYPKEAEEQGIEGRVNLLFMINGEGRVVELTKKGSHILLENEAERIIKLLPRMQPGRHNGKVVDMPFSIPITFKL